MIELPAAGVPVRGTPVRVAWTIWLLAVPLLLAGEAALLAENRLEPSHYASRADFERAQHLVALAGAGIYYVLPILVLLVVAGRVGLPRRTALLLLVPLLNVVVWTRILWRLTGLPYRPWLVGSTKSDPLSESRWHRPPPVG